MTISNKKRKFIKVFYSIAFSLLVFSCVNKQKNNSVTNYFLSNSLKNMIDDPSADSSKFNLGNMDIVDANSIYIYEGKLFKVTKENKNIEVQFKNKEGNIVKFKLPKIKRILKLTKNYIIVNFEQKPEYYKLGINFDWISYIVNTSTGKIYTYVEQGEKEGNPSITRELINIQTDKFGNIYFRNDVYQLTAGKKGYDLTSNVILMNIQNKPNIILKTLAPLNHDVVMYSNNKNGDLLYEAHLFYKKENKIGNLIHMYLSKDSDKPEKLEIRPEDMWQGLDGEIYYLDCHLKNQIINKKEIYKLKSAKTSEFYGFAHFSDHCVSYSNYIMNHLTFKDKIIRIPVFEKNKIRPIFPSKKPNILEVYNKKTNQPRLIDLGNGLDGTFDYYYLGSSDNYYYLQIKQNRTNTDFVLKVDPKDDSSTKIINQYIVHKFAVDSNDNIIFEGLRKSDMATTVLAKIPGGQTETHINILSDNIEKGGVTVLKPIN